MKGGCLFVSTLQSAVSMLGQDLLKLYLSNAGVVLLLDNDSEVKNGYTSHQCCIFHRFPPHSGNSSLACLVYTCQANDIMNLMIQHVGFPNSLIMAVGDCAHDFIWITGE